MAKEVLTACILHHSGLGADQGVPKQCVALNILNESSQLAQTMRKNGISVNFGSHTKRGTGTLQLDACQEPHFHDLTSRQLHSNLGLG